MLVTDYLHILSDKVWVGQNRIDIRAVWFDIKALTKEDVFQLPNGTTVRGDWVTEGGDQSIPAERREPRILCKKGKLSLQFHGTNISIRLGLNPGWGVGDVYIDGVRPPTIQGVFGAVDTVSCDSDAYGSPGAEYRDILIADNLSDGLHTLEVYCNNLTPGAGGFFVVTGCKVYSPANLTRTRPVWIANRLELPQPEVLTIKNFTADRVHEVTATFSAGLLDENGQPVGQHFWESLDAGGEVSVTVVPALTGGEATGEQVETCQLTALHPDPNGTEIRSTNVNVTPDTPGLEKTGAWWPDSGFGELRDVTNVGWVSVKLTVNADRFVLRVQRDYGWGTFRILKDTDTITGCSWTNGSNVITVPLGSEGPLQVGRYVTGPGIPPGATIIGVSGNTCTISATATQTVSDQLLDVDTNVTTVTCHDDNGGGFFVDVEVTGLTFSTGNKVKLVNDIADQFVVWSRITWATEARFTRRNETVQLKLQRKHVPPFPLTNTRIENGRVEWDPGASGQFDLSKPYDNRGVVEERAEMRFPTFIVIYQPGYLERIKEYDIAIVDPFAVTRKEVEQLQALGIKVINYVSFGEEDGTIADPWDTSSAQVPWTGDGQGPGGYASYYCKGGYHFGEMSECSHDRQRYEGVQACAMNNPNYNPHWSGRCSAACANDWREGYKTWEKGGACSAGHTSATFWQRSASKACTNASCPDYNPPHNKCTQYQQASAWGQDFSLITDFPDENGIWTSYYVNPVPTGPGSWYERIRDYYLPLVFGLPTPRDETLSVQSKLLTSGGVVLGIQLTHPPVDQGEPITITDVVTGYVYQKNLDWDIDDKLGIIKLHPTTGAPTVSAGQQIRVQYSTKGLNSDGVFMDTVDTVDIYPAEEYQAAAAKLINDMKALYPDRIFCSNRGFSILDRIIHSCEYVMFETFLSEHDWVNKTYYKIEDPAAVAWNNQITAQLMELRKRHVFDVLGLNYASNGPEGDELRAYIREETHKRGWLSWCSEILLNDPLPNAGFSSGRGPIRTNMWKVYRVKRKQ